MKPKMFGSCFIREVAGLAIASDNTSLNEQRLICAATSSTCLMKTWLTSLITRRRLAITGKLSDGANSLQALIGSACSRPSTKPLGRPSVVQFARANAPLIVIITTWLGRSTMEKMCGLLVKVLFGLGLAIWALFLAAWVRGLTLLVD